MRDWGLRSIESWLLRGVVVISFAAVCSLASADVPQLPAVKCAKPPAMDANPDDPAWKTCPDATDFKDMFTGQPVADQTECRLLYDDQAIYALFVCHDSRPDQIIGREITPEAQFVGEDTVTLTLDTFSTRSGTSLSKFTVNAINTRTEYIAGGRSSKAEWRGVWTSQTKRIAGGYVVEMRIPWRILSYPKSSKALDMDLNFERYQNRTKTNSQWAYVTPSYKPELIGLLKGVSPPAKDSRSRWQFLAYDAPTLEDGGISNRAGLDGRMAISNQQTALFTINPDFINIEQEIAGVNFVHTERFLTDARPFFTEGTDFFNPIPQYEYGIPFYSLNIGPVNAGAKFYGQLSPTTQLGSLAVNQTNGATASFTNFSYNPNAYYSQQIYATTYNQGPTSDEVVGTDFTKRWGYWFLHSSVAAEDNGSSRETAGNNSFGFSGGKLFSEVQQIWVDPSFNPPLAYVPWVDRRGFYTYTNYSDTFPKGVFHDWNWYLYTPDFYQSDHQAQERGLQGGLNFTTRDDQAISLNRSMTDYVAGTDNYYDLSYTLNSTNRFKQFGVEYLFGEQDSMPSRYVSLKGTYRAFHRIDLGLSQSVLSFSPDAQQTIATVGWQIDSRRSVTARYVDTNGFKNFFMSFQSAGFTGVEMYVILGDPNSLTFSKSLSLKFVWAF